MERLIFHIDVNSAFLSYFASPVTFEALLQKFFQTYSLTMTAQQYALMGSTIRPYLSSLHSQGKLTFFENNRLLWQTV